MPTYFITDNRMLFHKCEWYNEHIEKPERLQVIIDTLKEDGIINQCKQLVSEECPLEDLELVHSIEYINKIRDTTPLDLDEKEEFCTHYEHIYLNDHTWQAALISAGCALKAMKQVLGNPGNNAFAAIRPPGHHASRDTPCGFCYFNNVAICAKKARKLGAERVLIVDWDIHPGQGTQYSIEDDPGIKLISIHRFENGCTWPELPECATVQKYKNTINIPLNEHGYGDAEYAAFMNFLVLPLISEFKPDLILVSCGFDSAFGDPHGKMAITPGGYAYMTGALASLNIPLCFLLEGGYFLDSVAQGALHVVKALVQKKTPDNVLNNLHLTKPSETFLKTLYSAIRVNSKSFKIFDAFINVLNSIRKRNGLSVINEPTDEYKCTALTESYPYRTRAAEGPNRDPSIDKQLGEELRQIIAQYTNLETHKPIMEFKTKGYEEIGVLNIQSRQHFYVLMPLSFDYNITLDSIPLPLGDASVLKEFASQFAEGKNFLDSEGAVRYIEAIFKSYGNLKNFFLF